MGPGCRHRPKDLESHAGDSEIGKWRRRRQERRGTPLLLNQTAVRDDRIRRRITPLPDSARYSRRTSVGTLRLHPRGGNSFRWGSGEHSPSEPHSAPIERGPCLARAFFPGQPYGCRSSHDTRLPWAEWGLNVRVPCAFELSYYI